MSQDPVDEQPDGRESEEKGPADEAPRDGVEAALEQPPEGDVGEHFERRARLAEDRLAEVLSAYRTVKTENEGFRERVTRDLERRFDERRERLLLRFIDILDNLDRALEAAEQTFAGNPLVEGLILVRTQLLQTLQKEGLERIPVLGLPFNPAFSEAVGTQKVSEPEHDHVVVRELLRGYRLNGRVARASRVFVGQYEEGATAADPGTADAEGGDEELIGVDDESSSSETEIVAENASLDDETMRKIFGGDDEE